MEGGSRDPVSRNFLVPFLRWKTRSDVWCRSVVSALQVSRGTRNEASFTAVLLDDSSSPEKLSCSLTVCGEHVRTLRPDQSTCASLLNAALLNRAKGTLMNSLDGKRGCCMGFWLEEGVGMFRAMGRLLHPSIGGTSPILLLLEEGAPPLQGVLAELSPVPSSFLIVVGDNEGLTRELEVEIEAAVAAFGVPLRRCGLGGSELLASQCCTIVNFCMDTVLGPSSCQKPSYDPLDKYADKVRPCPVCRPDHSDLQ